MTLHSGRLDDGNRSDVKRSVSPRISPMLSPETSAALEDVERFMKDVQIQIKEIDKVANHDRFQKLLTMYPDEAALEDENDQLLYIRERVAHKFQEANGWLDATAIEAALKRENRNGVSSKPKKTVDFSSSKFQTSNRYKEYSQYEGTEVQRLGFPSAGHILETAEEPGNSRDSRFPGQLAAQNRRMDGFSVRVCPPVNIKGQLMSRNLGNVHISPNPSFVQETANARTYVFSHGVAREDGWPRREKFVKIVERELVQEGKGETGVQVLGSKEKSAEEVCRISEGLKENVESRDIGTSMTCMEDQANLEKVAEDDVAFEDKESREDKETQIQDDLKTEAEAAAVGEGRCDCTKRVIPESRNNQKQVRFDEAGLEDRDVGEEPRGAEETNCTSDPNLITPTTVQSENRDDTTENELKNTELSIEVETNSDTRSSSKETKEKREKDERYKMIDQSFANVLKKHRGKTEKRSTGNHFATESEKSSREFEDLYDPSIHELDDVLGVYDRMIKGVARSAKTIDRFLSRPELRDYCMENKSASSESLGSSLNKSEAETTRKTGSRHLQAKRNAEARSKNSGLKHANNEWHLHKTRLGAARPLASSSGKVDNDSGKKFSVSRRSNKFQRAMDLNFGPEKRKLRCNEWRENFRGRDDSFSPTSSGHPLSSSSDTKLQTVDDPRIFEPITLEDLKRSTASTQPVDSNDLQKGIINSTTLHSTVCSNVLKQVLSELKDTTSEYLIRRALQEETRFIEDKIRNAFNLNQIVPTLVRNVLEHLQSDTPSFKGGTAESVSENRVSTNEGSANFEIVRKIETTCLESVEFGRENEDKDSKIISADSTEVSKSLSSAKTKKSLSNESKDSNSNAESSKDTSDEKTNEINSDRSVENVSPRNSEDTKGNKSDESNFGKNSLSIANESVGNNLNAIAETERNDVNLYKNNGKTSTIEKLEVKNIELQVFGMENKNSPVSNDETSKINKETELQSVPIEGKLPSDNFERISSSDSLRDCASIRSSPRNFLKTIEMKEPRPVTDTLDVEFQEIVNQNSLKNMFQRKQILSEFYDTVTKELLFDKNDTSVLEHRRLPSSTVTTESNNVQTSSDTSRSEGELHAPSSSSYSLGEVKMTKKNHSEGETTN